MLLPPFWRGRGRNVPAGNRTSRARAVLRGAQKSPLYSSLDSAFINAPRSAIELLSKVPLTPQARWTEAVGETLSSGRTLQLSPYQDARRGKVAPEPLQATLDATADLLRLSQAISEAPQTNYQAVVVFSSFGAGLLTLKERDRIWEDFQTPLFENLVTPSGAVLATECEVHAGLHICSEAAVFHIAEGRLVVTSLLDFDLPILRVWTDISAKLEESVCECGRTETRIIPTYSDTEVIDGAYEIASCSALL